MKLAVLGASFLQRDLIEKAKMLGHEVHALAWAKGEVVSDLVDGFHDVSLRDVRAVVERCVALGIEGVTTTSSDVAVPAMAAVAEEMGLKAISLKTAQLATHKGAMRTAFQQAGCAIPRFEVFPSMPTALDFSPPFLVKASDRSGSRGVAVIRDKEDWRSAYLEAMELSFSGDVVIEEYFEGRQFSVEMISDQGEHYFCGLTEEFFDAGDASCEKGHLMPGRLDADRLAMVIRTVKEGLDALGIDFGPSHSEIRVAEDGRCCIIEIGARLGGDFRNRLVKLAYGIDLDEWVIRQALGEEVALHHGLPCGQAMISWVFDQQDFAVLSAASKSAFIDSFDFPAGEAPVVRPKSSDQRAGYVIVSNASEQGEQWVQAELIRNGW